jgi:hypothetical protein
MDDRGRVVRWRGGPFLCEVESHAARLPRRPAAPPPGCPAALLPGCPAARPPRRPAARLPGCPAARPPCCPAALLPGRLPLKTKKARSASHHGPGLKIRIGN